MNATEYESLKSQAKAEYERTLEAIERVWNLSRTLGRTSKGKRQKSTRSVSRAVDRVPSATEPPAVDRDPPADTGKSLPEQVHEILPGLPDRFTIHDVLPQMPGVDRTSLSGALRRLSESGVVNLLQQGRGKRASVYAKLGVPLEGFEL